jgi:predicted PurR-regulated permease PerM
MIPVKPKDEALIFKPAFKLSSMAALLLLSTVFLLWIPGLLTSFLISIIFVFILAPAVDFFERHGVSRSNSILLVFSLIVLAAVLIAMLMSHAVVKEYEDLLSRMDVYTATLKDELNRQATKLEHRFGLEKFKAVERLLTLGQSYLVEYTTPSGDALTTVSTWFALVPVLLYFFLLDGHKIKKAFIGFLPNRYFEMSLNIHQKITRIVGSFIRAKMMESLIVGVLTLVGFIITGIIFEPLNYAIFLALLTGLFNIIPYLGPIIGAIPVLLVAILQYVLLPQFPEFGGAGAPNWVPVLFVAGTLVVAQVIDNFYLTNVLLGNAVDVHPLVVLFSVILGAQFLGVTGMIISIPLAGIAQTMVREVADGIRHLRH